MLRTLIFGGIVAYVGKKLYDDGTLTQFRDDLARRLRPEDAGDRQPSKTGTAPPAATTPQPVV
ncbi:hypothetical protein PX699_15055 [Sphingobium sp. H39-3-25]|uniref:hypothetical protein n=1 Tax=Sphingobium arseniciresistens TaxID=3030834 RepID=UPI0023B955E1|nr:hypothetical protein [Sphingobium arseniciresistens]